ncbi:MAG: GlcG/HbpS family heme-binding protein [Gammaproteobacteria bacterium]
MNYCKKNIVAALALLIAMPVSAEDMISVKTIGMELARDIASEAVLACRKMGYQVSAVVVDRNGNIRAALRDDLASRFTLQIAEEKANAAIMSGISSGQFVKSRSDIQQELNHVDGLIMMQGGEPVLAAGSRIGAVGVSGAPGGDLDEKCAKIALEKFEERLEFAD